MRIQPNYYNASHKKGGFSSDRGALYLQSRREPKTTADVSQNNKRILLM
jgi:hypothetical protein